MKVTDPVKIAKINEIYEDFVKKIHGLELEREEIRKQLVGKLDKKEIDKLMKKIKDQ